MKEMEGCCPGKTLVAAAFLIALAVVVGSYLLAQVDYSPKVNVSDITSIPNVYVSSMPPEHVITASATVTKKVTPDLLLVELRVQTQEDNAKESQERNAVVMAELRDELEALGMSEEDIQTSYYRVDVVKQSEYVCDESRCHYEYTVIGYKTVHELTLNIEELDKGGEIIDAATGVGDNETFVDYVDFTLKDDTRAELEKELLKDAAAEAKEKAQNIAQGLGISLGKPVSASESIYYPYRSYKGGGYDMAYAEAAPTTELSAGEVEASATVNVGFEIG